MPCNVGVLTDQIMRIQKRSYAYWGM